MPKLFTTEPHGEQLISELPRQKHLRFGNRLYRIRDTGGKEMVFTGEELSSLASQWTALANKELRAVLPSRQTPNRVVCPSCAGDIQVNGLHGGVCWYCGWTVKQ